MKKILYIILPTIIFFLSGCDTDCTDCGERKIAEANQATDVVKAQLQLTRDSLVVAQQKADSLDQIVKLVFNRNCIIERDPSYKEVVIKNLPAFLKLKEGIAAFDKYNTPDYITPLYNAVSESWTEAFNNEFRHKREMLEMFANENPTEFKEWGLAAIQAYSFDDTDEISDVEHSTAISRTIGAITEYTDPNQVRLRSIIDSIQNPYWEKRKKFELELWDEFKKVNL